MFLKIGVLVIITNVVAEILSEIKSENIYERKDN